MGCPNQCSFCNQKSISGQAKQINADDVKAAVNTALEGRDCAQAEIAFFGGSLHPTAGLIRISPSVTAFSSAVLQVV